MCFLKGFLTLLCLVFYLNDIITICSASDDESIDNALNNASFTNSTYDFDDNSDYNINGNISTINTPRVIETKADYRRIKFLSQFFKIPPECPSEELNSTLKEKNYCPLTNDTLLCFPSIPPNEVINITCPFNDNIQVNGTNIVAIKYCNSNGTWAKTDYTLCFQYVVSFVHKTTCRKINKTIYINETLSVIREDVQCDPVYTDHEDQAIRLLPILFLIGYTVALIPVTLAIFIFWSFRSLRCLRNMIHSNMLMTFILKSLIFIIFKLYLSNSKIDDTVEHVKESTVVCLLFQVLWHYALLTSFFWMMIEGIYLISVVIAAYSSNKIKLWWYLIIGWIVPIVPIIPYTVFTVRSSKVSCQWIRSNSDSNHELFVDIPIYAVLAVNFILLVIILLVIIKKLKENNDAAKARYNQYRKLIRATIVLFPLLGLTYGMFFWLPKNPKSLIAIIYCYVNIFFQTTQGIWVAIVYCFYNEEVKTAIKNKFRSWKSARNLHVLHQFGSGSGGSGGGGGGSSSRRKTSRTSIASSLTASFARTSFTRTRLIGNTNNTNDQTTAAAMIPMLNKKQSIKENDNTFVKIPENGSI